MTGFASIQSALTTYRIHPSNNDIASTAGQGVNASEELMAALFYAMHAKGNWVDSGWNYASAVGLVATFNGGEAVVEGRHVVSTGTCSYTLENNATNHIWLTWTETAERATALGLYGATSDTPPSTPYIKLATITTSAGAVTGSTDERVLAEPLIGSSLRLDHVSGAYATLTLSSAGNLTLVPSGGGLSLAGVTISNLGIVTTVDINGGTIDGAAIGGAVPAAGAFTTLSASGTTLLSGYTRVGNTAPTTPITSGLDVVGGAAGLTFAVYDDNVLGTPRFSVARLGAVTVSGDFSVATTKFTVAAATGNTVIAGTLSSGVLTATGTAPIRVERSAVASYDFVLSSFYADANDFLLQPQTNSTGFGFGTKDDAGTVTYSLIGNKTGLIGVNTLNPGAQLDINSATGACLRLTYNDANGSAVNYSDFSVSATGDLTIAPSGGDLNVTGAMSITGTLALADNELSRPRFTDYAITGSAIGNLGATETIDLTVANFFTATLDQACVFTFSNPPATGHFGGFSIMLTNGGAFAITWPASVDWAGGVAPVLTASGKDLIAFVTHDAGTTWHGYVVSTDSK